MSRRTQKQKTKLSRTRDVKIRKRPYLFERIDFSNHDAIKNLIRICLNTMESQAHIIESQKKDIQSLKDEINRLKGEKGNDKIVSSNRSESF